MANTLNLGDGNWATKKDSLLGYNSENNNFKPLPFDFTRSSSATRINKNGKIETINSGEPKIDFLGNTKGTLLLEPSRSNLILTSARGTYGNSPASEANTTSPDGTNNAYIPTPDSASDRYEHSIGSNTYATNTKLSYSWYRKRISTPITTSYIGDLQMNVLVNVTQVGSTTQIQSDVNGFDRFQAIFNITDGSSYTTIRAYFGTVVGIGNSSVAYFGHQLEVGNYATSYIPTQGSAVTRLADSCDNAGNDQVINSTEGVLYAEISALADDGTARYFSLNNGSSNRVRFGYGTSTNSVRLFVASTTTQVDLTVQLSDITLFNKFAIKYKANDFAIWVNGIEVATDTNGNTPVGLVQLNFDNCCGTDNFYGNTKDLRVYNTRLTDQELQALTTI